MNENVPHSADCMLIPQYEMSTETLIINIVQVWKGIQISESEKVENIFSLYMDFASECTSRNIKMPFSWGGGGGGACEWKAAPSCKIMFLI